MNDATPAQEKKQAKTAHGAAILARIEDGFLKLHDLIGEAHAAEMMPICECHELQNKAMELYYGTLGLHCRLTHVAQRNECDVPGQGEPTPVPQGGPGR